MDDPEVFTCPICGEGRPPQAHAAHLSAAPEERRALFARFVAEHDGRLLPDTRCTGSAEILPLLDAAEKERFGLVGDRCGEAVLACPCGGSFCAEHTFACVSCGRFACLRHRWSARCPDCAKGTRSRPVKVEKYDPFSKQRSTFVRKYRRSAEVRPWTALSRPAGDDTR